MDDPLTRSIFLKATLAILNKRRQTPLTYMKPKQTQCILNSVLGNHVLGILPTGYGKSLVFEAASVLKNLLFNAHHKTILISPLNVIIEQQLTSLGERAKKIKESDLNSDSGEHYLLK